MSTTYSTLVFNLLIGNSGADADVRDFVTARALENVEENWQSVRNLINMDLIDIADHWDSLKACPVDTVRALVWDTYAAHVTPEEWETALEAERDCLEMMRTIKRNIPLDRVSQDAVCALMGVPVTGKLKRNDAYAVINYGWQPGVEPQWMRALENLPPGRINAKVLEIVLKCIEGGSLPNMPDTVPAFYRVAAACSPTAEPGTLARMRDEDPAWGPQLGFDIASRSHTWSKLLHANLVGRRADLEAYQQLLHQAGLVASPELAPELAAVYDTGDVVDQLVASRAVQAPDGVDIWRCLWRNLGAEGRTDDSCAHLLGLTAIDVDLHLEVIAHLGERAGAVCAAAGLIPDSQSGSSKVTVPLWLPHVDVDAWIGLLKRSVESQDEVKRRLQHAPAHAVEQSARDLLADSPSWGDRGAVTAIAEAAEFGPLEWCQLTLAQVTSLALNHNAARRWFADVFNGNDDLLNPVAWEALRVSADANMRFDELLDAVTALTTNVLPAR